MAREGSREIEAARRRLAAAEAHESSTSAALKLAEETFEALKKSAESAREEVGRAAEFLREAEKRWEVVDVDVDEDDNDSQCWVESGFVNDDSQCWVDSGSSKRRKTSTESTGGNSAVSDDEDEELSVSCSKYEGLNFCNGEDEEGEEDEELNGSDDEDGDYEVYHNKRSLESHPCSWTGWWDYEGQYDAKGRRCGKGKINDNGESYKGEYVV